MFQNVVELVAIFSGALVTKEVVLTPFWIKSLKDISLAIVLAFAALTFARERRRFTLYDCVLLLALMLAAGLTISTKGTQTIQIVAGIRAFYPVLLVVLLRGRVFAPCMSSIADALSFAMFVMLGLQCYELFNMPHWDGTTFFLLNKRNPGYFLVVNSAGFFTITSWIYIYWHSSRRLLRKALIWFIIPISVFLSASGTAVVSLLALICANLYLRIRQKALVIALSPFVLVAGFASLTILTHRDDIFESPAMRVAIFGDLISHSLIPLKFGAGTNSAVLISDGSAEAVIVDSTLNSLLYNTGIFGLLAFALTLLHRLQTRTETIFLAIGMIAFALTTIVYEIYPMNFLVFLYFAHLSSGGNPKPKASPI
jgi:hypothetical protein